MFPSAAKPFTANAALSVLFDAEYNGTEITMNIAELTLTIGILWVRNVFGFGILRFVVYLQR